MPREKSPRAGSMQFWPRVRSKRMYTSVHSWAKEASPKLLGFAGYKVGMTHLMVTDNRPVNPTKGEIVSFPATIIECPPLKIHSLRFYKKTPYGLSISTEIITKSDKELSRKVRVAKKEAKTTITDLEKRLNDFVDVRAVVHTQPKLTGIGKRKPEMFEMGIGGTLQQKVEFFKQHIGKDIAITDVFKEGDQTDLHVVTKGKGFQGPIRRFGISKRKHKSEKSIRNPGSLGGWRGQGHVMYRVAHAGKMGFHIRTEYNKQLLKIGTKPEEINPDGGFHRYGVVKNSYVLIKGSVAGPAKRLIRLTRPIRKNKLIPAEAPTIETIAIKE